MTAREQYRVVSSLGDQYVMPMAFESLEAAEHHVALHDQLFAGLPGAGTLQVQRRTVTVGEWVAA